MNQTQKHTTGKKLLALLLALIMSVSLLPMSVFAADLDSQTDEQTVVGQGVEDAVPGETDGQAEEAVPQEDVEEDSAPVEEDTEDDVDVTDDIATQEGDVAVQAAEISYVTKISDGKKLDDSTFYRIVHIDCGRKYFSADDLKKIIDYAYEYGYTHVELAFGNDGLRFLLDDMTVSVNGEDTDVTAAIQYGNKQFDAKASYSPEVTNEELSQSEMTDIIAYAKGKGIGIIPMFDVPGHLYAVIQAMQKLGVDVTGYYEGPGSGSSPNWAISPTNVASVNFVQALVQKYITYFKNQGCTMFNIAADESGISTTNYLAYAKLVNSVAAMVQNAGMVALAFNDGIYNPSYTSALGSYEFDSNIAICYWDAGGGTSYAQAKDLAENKGFKIINTHNGWYYVIGKENITGKDWSGYAYTCEYAKQQMSSENSCLNIDGDNKQTTPAGCMAAIWCDYPANSANWTNVESYIKTLAQYNTAYFVKKSTPAVKIVASATSVKVGDTVTLSLSDNSAAEWTSSNDSVLKLNTVATYAADNSVTATAIAKGTATVTATVGDNKYTQDITVTEVGDETFDSEKDIYVTVGGTATENVSGANHAGSYTTKDESVASVTVTGEDEKEGSAKYTSTSVTYSDLAGGNTSWTKTQYYYKSGSSYYPVYAYQKTTSNGFPFGGSTTTYYYGYSTTDSAADVKNINSSTRGNNSVRNLYTKTGGDPTPASTTITFKGNKVGDTYVIIGGVKYNIYVVEEDLSKAGTLPMQLWFTNCDIQAVATENNKQYTVGQTTGEFASYGGTSPWQENVKPYYVSVSARDAYGKDGVPLSEVLPATMYRYENSNTYWQQEYTGKTQKELVLWSGRIHSSGNIQLISGKDYSNTGTEFQYVRYFGGTWAVSADRVKWTKVTGTGSTTSASTCTEQLAVYYMMRSKITTEVTTDVADWGYIDSDSNYGTQIGSGNYVILDFAVKYENGTRNPDEFPQTGKTFVFHCTPDDASGSVKKDTSGNYYRQLNNFRGVNTSDYEIYMVTVTMTSGSAGTKLGTSETEYSYDYKNTEQIVWAIDEKTRDDSGFEEYQAITNNDTTYSGCKIGGDPYVRGVEVYNQHGALITYYIRSRAVEGQLTVHYIDKASNNEFYHYNITIKDIDDMNQRFKETIRLNPDNWKGNLLDGDVVNHKNVTLTVSSDLSTMPGVPAGYRYAISYTCKEVTHNAERTDVYLYYEFVSGKTFVVDFGLPLKITPKDFSNELENATLEKVSVSDSAYANITTDGLNVIYTLNKTIDGEDNITVGYNGKITVTTEEGPKEQTGFVSYTVTIIPASTVYYEDSFATFYNSNGDKQTQFTQTSDGVNENMGVWYADGAELTSMPTQALEELGNKKNVYGYDDAYTQGNSTTFSMGSAKKVTVNAKLDKAPTATFTFKGTGFDVISLTDNNSGAIVVNVKRTDTNTAGYKEYDKNFLVNNYYGYEQVKADDGTITWEVSENKNPNALYQIPVMKVTGLDYGEYAVTINVGYGKFFDKTDDGQYSFWMDAIRVYDPMGKDYDYKSDDKSDNESYPQYIKLRDALADEDAVIAGEGKVVFIDGGNTGDITTYANYGPNNEVYLAAGQAISFQVPVNADIASIQIGAKVPLAEKDGAAAMSITGGAALKDSAKANIATATEMYYDLTYEQGETVIIANNGVGILSLTNLKITFTKEQSSDIVLTPLTTLEQTEAVAAVRALFAAPVEPEPDPEPVTFEPDRFEVSWNRSTVKVGQKATLTVKTSEDVEAITVDGETVTGYRTRTQRTGWGWNAKKVTYREFTYTVTAAEAGTLDVSVAAVNAEGVSSAAVTATVTVQAASQRPGFGGWLDNIFGRWF